MELVAHTHTTAEIINPLRIEELVNSFINDQDVRDSSRYIYRGTLKQFLLWIGERSYSLNEIARAHVLEYKDSLLAKGMSSLTVGSYLTVVRMFYEWTEANKIYPNVAKGVKTPKRKQQFRKEPLTPKEAKALLKYYRNKEPRDYAIVSLLLRTGLRTIEVTRANIEDITVKRGKRVLLVHGKGSHEKDNFVVLTDKAYKPIEEYLKQRGRVNNLEPLFTSTSNNNQGGRLTTRTISQIAKTGLVAIGLDAKAYTAHSLRHTAGTNILEAGGTLEQVQRTLRHTNPATTQIYTATREEKGRLENPGESLLDKLY